MKAAYAEAQRRGPKSGEASPPLAIYLAGPLHDYFLRQPLSSYSSTNMHMAVWPRTRHFLSLARVFLSTGWLENL